MASRAVDARTRALVEGPCAVTMAGAASPVEDAAAERRRATFDSEELARFLHGGEDKLARRWVAIMGWMGCGGAAAACAASSLS